MSILSVEHISKGYGDKQFLNGLSFTISQQQRIGLIGVNGTGKSSLLKILAELETADTGNLDHAKDFSIEYLPQDQIWMKKKRY